MRYSQVYSGQPCTVVIVSPGIIIISGLISPTASDIQIVADELSKISDDKTIHTLDSGDAINLGSFTLPKHSISTSPSRFTDLFGEQSNWAPSESFKSFVQQCEQSHYDAAVVYASIYPDVAKSLWWRPHGHIARYGPGQHIGFHADTDVEHQWGALPLNQKPIHNVVSINLYINGVNSVGGSDNSFSGGDIIWKYPNFRYAPGSGDIVIYPSNFLGTHAVSPVLSGMRYAFLSVAGYGVDIASGEYVGQGVQTNEPIPMTTMGRTWMPKLQEHSVEAKSSYHIISPSK